MRSYVHIIVLLVASACSPEPATDEPGSTAEDAATGEASPDADHPYIQYYGRWDHADKKAAVARWGAVYIVARFTGTSCAVRLDDEQLTVSEDFGTGNAYQFSIDGAPFTVLPSTKARTYTLAENLARGSHTVTLVRRTEGTFGKTTFRGFNLDASGQLLEPAPRPSRKLEVFGDSISSGLANENTGQYTNLTQNGYEAFGPLLARSLDAEWRVEARGGGSLYTDWLPMIPWFDKVYGPLDLQHLPDSEVPRWSFELFQPDVFILALGTNDSSDEYPASDEADYVAKYVGFLKDLRRVYPRAQLFALAPFKEGASWDLVRAHIQKAVQSLADARVHAIVPVQGAAPTYTARWLTYPDDYVTGDEFHPNLEGHRKIAERLRAIVAAELAW